MHDERPANNIDEREKDLSNSSTSAASNTVSDDQSDTTVESAAAIAKVNSEWERWARGSRVFPWVVQHKLPDAAIPVSDIFGIYKAPSILLSMDEEERTAIRNHTSARLPSDLPHLEEFLNEVDDHGETHHSISEAIDLQIKPFLPWVVSLTRKLQGLQGFQRPIGGSRCEAEWRQPVDELAARVFSETSGTRCSYRLKFQIVVPHSDRPGGPKTATLDAAVVLSSGWAGNREDAAYAEEVCCTTTLATGSFIPIIFWAAEYKEARGRNQLLYGLAIAQRQRLAMGIDGHVVYGIALKNSIASVYVTWVDTDSPCTDDDDKRPRIYVRHLAELDLRRPLQALQFLFLLLKVKDDIQRTRNQLTDLTTEKLKTAQGVNPSWKAIPPTPAPSGFQPSGKPVSGIDGGGTTHIATNVYSTSKSKDDESQEIVVGQKDEIVLEADNWEAKVKDWIENITLSPS